MQEKLKYYRTLADEFLNSSISLTKMAAREGTTRQTLAKHFRELGVEIINKQNRLKFDNTVFDCIDTEEKAYWLGFIFADGYISSDSLKGKSRYLLEISLKASDKNHLDKFNKFMKHENANKVTIEDAKCGKVICKRCRWYVANKHLWETLNSYGCTPRKSLTLKFPDKSIFKSKDLIRHFIRGYFDGDGCISYANKEHTIPSYQMLGTKEFLKVIMSYLNIEETLFHNHNNKKEVTMYIQASSRKAMYVLHKLYDNCSIYLNRKYEKFIYFCRIFEKSNMLKQTNIGEGCDADTEITTEIKESVAS